MKLRFSSTLIVVLYGFSLAISGAAQPPADAIVPLSTGDKDTLLRTLERDITEHYVFSEVATQISKSLVEFENSKEYQATTDAKAYAALLKSELQKVGNDKHLGVEYSEQPISASDFDTKSPSAEEKQKRLRTEQSKNFCFQKVERLAGNIGYLDLRCFDDAAIAGPTAAAAMEFISNTQAIIIDLRHNGGGDPHIVAFLISYLFGNDPIHLNDLRFRADNRVQQFWTLPYVPGIRTPDKDVYVLTSGRTFSAAEEFAYDLQALQRAAIVGEVTRGGANFGGAFVLNEHFVAFIPIGHAVNPITKSNWEGVGVHPDVPVSADRALDTAYVMALGKVREKSVDPQAREEIDTAIADAKKHLNP